MIKRLILISAICSLLTACSVRGELRSSYTVSHVSTSLTSAYLLVPNDISEPLPAVVLLHDHGAHFTIGKEKLVRPLSTSPSWLQLDATAWTERYLDSVFVADALAEQGFVVIVPDAYGWGESSDISVPDLSSLPDSVVLDTLKHINKRYQLRQPDIAAALYDSLHLTWMQQTVRYDQSALDYLCSLPFVDTTRIYSFGFSMGAVRSWSLAAIDSRISACAFSNWMTTRSSLAAYNPKQLTGPSSTSMSIDSLFPGLDYPEVASLVAPRPMLMMAGTEDRLFAPASVDSAAAVIRSAYLCSDHADSAAAFTYQTFPVPHYFGRSQLQTLISWLANL